MDGCRTLHQTIAEKVFLSGTYIFINYFWTLTQSQEILLN